MSSWTALVMYINQIGVLSRPEQHRWTHSDQQKIFSTFLWQKKDCEKSEKKSGREQWICVSRVYFMYMYNIVFGISGSPGCTLGTFPSNSNETWKKMKQTKILKWIANKAEFSEEKLFWKYLHWWLKYFTKNCNQNTGKKTFSNIILRNSLHLDLGSEKYFLDIYIWYV